MDVQRVFDLLLLWGAWSRVDDSGPVVKDECGSAERHWRPPGAEVMDDDRRPAPVLMADHEAQRVERAVVSLGLPHRALIVQVFVRMVPLELAARRVGAPNARHVLNDALARIGRGLTGLPDQRRRDDRYAAGVRIAEALEGARGGDGAHMGERGGCLWSAKIGSGVVG